MRKIYIAKRIISNTFDDAYVEIEPNMSADSLVGVYQQKQITRENYIHNGHWILRAVNEKEVLEKNNLPADLTPQHIMEMVLHKINDADGFLAVINSKAYGAIVELGYAVGTDRHAVYVLPDKDVTEEERKDLWMSFHLALRTQHLWTEEDIQSLEDFSQRKIYSLDGYKQYILDLIPNFLK